MLRCVTAVPSLKGGYRSHSPYVSHLALSGFFLFLRQKHNLNLKSFGDVKAIKSVTKWACYYVEVELFQGCFKMWERRLDKCIDSTG